MSDTSFPAIFRPEPANDAEARLRKMLAERIVFLDGAMGTTIQQYKLQEADFRGDRFPNPKEDLKGNNDLLTLTKPDVIYEIHRKYLEAGSDIIETNTFSGTTIAQADYHLQEIVDELNVEAARLAKKACDDVMQANPARAGQCFVAGAIGPMNRTLSMSRDVNDPGKRDVTFDQVKDAYKQQIAALVKGGVDLLLIETIFDTLNAKAAIFAAEEYFEESGTRLPLAISGTITDQSGRTLSGQTTEAFWHSVRHSRPLFVGMNCALGADLMRPYIEELSRVANTYISCYPNAGLPDPLSETGFPEGPDDTAAALVSFAKSKLVNLVGGCCGTTPAHIKAICEQVSQYPPRPIPQVKTAMRLSGLEPLTLG